jgi:hypothetical protein
VATNHLLALTVKGCSLLSLTLLLGLSVKKDEETTSTLGFFLIKSREEAIYTITIR